jgi:hypothetical protein
MTAHYDSWIVGGALKSKKIRDIDNKTVGYIYRVYRDNVQEGYIIYKMDSGIVEASFEGKDSYSEVNGNKHYILPRPTFFDDVPDMVLRNHNQKDTQIKS